MTDQNQEKGGKRRVFNEEATKKLINTLNVWNLANIRELIEQGADVNTKNDIGNTPLHNAAEGGATQTVKFLIEHKADVTAKNNDGQTPLHYTARSGATEAVKFLIEHTADVNVQDKHGNTPLYYAARFGKTETVKTLIEQGAEVNVQNKHGETPLHKAAEFSKTETVKTLIDNGADVNVQDKHGNTPLYYAARYGKTETVKTLIDNGADVNVQDKHGETLLYIAARYGTTKTVKFLIEAGANVNLKDNEGHTALFYYNHNPAIQQLLYEHGAIPNSELSNLATDSQSVHTTAIVDKSGFYTDRLIDDTKIKLELQEIKNEKGELTGEYKILANNELVNKSKELYEKLSNLKYDDKTIALLDISRQEKGSVLQTCSPNKKSKLTSSDEEFVNGITADARNALADKFLRTNNEKNFDWGYPSAIQTYGEHKATIPQILVSVGKVIEDKKPTTEEMKELCATAISKFNNDGNKDKIFSLAQKEGKDYDLSKASDCHKLLAGLPEDKIGEIFKSASGGLDINEAIKQKDYFTLKKQIFVAANTYGDNSAACIAGTYTQILESLNEIKPEYLEDYMEHVEEQKKLAETLGKITDENVDKIVDKIVPKLAEYGNNAENNTAKEAIIKIGYALLNVDEPEKITKEEQKVLGEFYKALYSAVKEIFPERTNDNIIKSLTPEEYKTAIYGVARNEQMQQVVEKLEQPAQNRSLEDEVASVRGFLKGVSSASSVGNVSPSKMATPGSPKAGPSSGHRR